MAVFGEEFIVDKTTICLLYDEPIDKEIEHCNTKDDNVTVCGRDQNVSDKRVHLFTFSLYKFFLNVMMQAGYNH
jgi:predicted amino acid racemase